MLAACGLNNRLVHTVNLNYTDAAARLADGTIDAMFVTAGLHADALEQLAKTCAIRLLSVDGGVGARLLAAYPAYRACVIPAGTYAGQGEDVWTVSVQALLLASNALSDETVQRLTARYFDSVDAVAAAVPVPLVTDPAMAAAQSVIPYHWGRCVLHRAGHHPWGRRRTRPLNRRPPHDHLTGYVPDAVCGGLRADAGPLFEGAHRLSGKILHSRAGHRRRAVAVFTCLCYVTGIAEFEFDDILKEVCMVFFFTSVGFQANLKGAESGGKSLIIFLGLVVALIFVPELPSPSGWQICWVSRR